MFTETVLNWRDANMLLALGANCQYGKLKQTGSGKDYVHG